jgi:hypothetical protein
VSTRSKNSTMMKMAMKVAQREGEARANSTDAG